MPMQYLEAISPVDLTSSALQGRVTFHFGVYPMNRITVLCLALSISSCAFNPSPKDQALMEKYPDCTNRENFLMLKQPDNNCIVTAKLNENLERKEAIEFNQREVRRQKEIEEQKKLTAERKKLNAIDHKKNERFNSLPGITYDDFISRVIEKPDDIGWSTTVKTRYGMNAPFIPVVKQQTGENSYIIQSMLARDNPNKKIPGSKGHLLLAKSASTLIVGYPIDKPHTLRYQGITTVKTVLGAPIQVISVTLIESKEE